MRRLHDAFWLDSVRTSGLSARREDSLGLNQGFLGVSNLVLRVCVLGLLVALKSTRAIILMPKPIALPNPHLQDCSGILGDARGSAGAPLSPWA